MPLPKQPRLFLSLLVLCCLGAGVVEKAHAQAVAAQDSLALVALYLATTVNEPWDHKNGFAQAVDNDPTNDTPVSQWRTREAVQVENGRVVYVRLFSNNLNGTLPDEICSLTALRELDLTVNKLIGPIPACIGEMAALTKIEIWAGNDMTGPLPEGLGDLENLEVLNLRNNELTGVIPEALGNLTNLKELELQNNQLTGGIPSALGQLTNLEVLKLGSNDLMGSIPESLGNLTNLLELELVASQLAGPIPDFLGNLTNLTVLRLDSNGFTGTIPASLGQLSNLVDLVLSSNELTSFEPGTYEWPNLERFIASANHLTNLPDLSGVSRFVAVVFNNLSFADLEPVANLGLGDGFRYLPQRPFVLETHQTIEDGIVMLSVDEDGMATTYQWEQFDPATQAWMPIAGATETSYAPTEPASYRCMLENPRLPDMTLYSGAAVVELDAIVVNSAGDAANAEANDGICDTGETIDRDGQEEPECTLRAAIHTVNNPGSGKTMMQATPIAFNIPGQGVPIIASGTALPDILQPVKIDGTTQQGGFVVLQGVAKSFSGLIVQEGGRGSTLQGLNMSDFLVAIDLRGGGENSVASNVFTGNGTGVLIEESSSNTVRDNVIADHSTFGIALFSPFSRDNQVIGNKIGTDAGGNSPREIGLDGIVISDASRTTISGNIISSSGRYGVHIIDDDEDPFPPSENTIEDNKIGTDITGTLGLPNCVGIRAEGAASATIRNNTISANVGTQCGRIEAAGLSISRSKAVTIAGNVIGTDASGTMPLPNGSGIRLTSVSMSTIQDNVISSNVKEGLYTERGETSNSIIGNKIGTDINGTMALGNGGHGVVMMAGLKEHIFQNNVISANGLSGVFIGTVGLPGGSRFEGNFIGTAIGGTCALVSGACPLGNGEHGVEIERGRGVNLKRNVISGNTRNGVFISSGATSIDVEENRIGTDAEGRVPLGNGTHGIAIDEALSVAIKNNVISANRGSGLFVTGKDISISDNKVGTDANGADVLGVMGNQAHGIVLDRTDSNNVVRENLIAYNHNVGVLAIGTTGGSIRQNTIRRNTIGVQVLGGAGQGIQLNIIERNIERGIDAADGVRDLVIKNNTVQQNGGTSTGIHLTAATAIIEGNEITGDAGDAITLEQGSRATVTTNNIFDNAGMGLNNLDPSVTVTASGNWWGDASGPGGQGPGSGDAVSTSVDFSGWRSEKVAVVVSAENDEIFLPTGETDTVSVFLQNWQVRDDALDLTVSDTQGWLQSPATLAVTLTDSTGAEARLAVAVPAGTPSGTTSTVEVTATSQADASHTITMTFTLRAESAVLGQVLVVPNAVEVAPGDTVLFNALGLDQFSRTVEITPTWSATGGTINGNGIYVAGTAAGEFAVTATDPTTGLSGTSRVGNGVPVAVVEEAEVPETFRLDQNYPNPFNPSTAIAYMLPQQAHVRLVIYDMLGREVAVLVDAVRPVGAHTAQFDAGTLPSGVYVYRMQAGSYSQTRAMVLLR